jgi:RNA polymerase sigma-70 factor (ECF subfamily)
MVQSLTTRASLLVRMRDARDAGAWGEFVDRYAPLVHRFCRKQGLQDADAADLTQEILGKLCQAIPRLEYDPRRGGFRGWLFTVVRNRLRDFFDHKRRRAQASGDTENLRFLAEVPERDDGLREQWDQGYRSQLYTAAAQVVRRDVAEITWRAFQRTAIDGRTPAEVSKELRITVATVYLAKSRVMARLKEEVKRLEAEDEEGQR